MVRLNPRQREVVADKLLDVVNLVTAAIAIGFFIGQPRASAALLIASVAFWLAALLVVLFIVRKYES